MSWYDILFCSCLVVLGLCCLWLVGFIVCRIGAKVCPSCGEKWFTELQGEWDGVEDWRCIRCNRKWSVPYPVSPNSPPKPQP